MAEHDLALPDAPLTPEDVTGLSLSSLNVMIRGANGGVALPDGYVAVFDVTKRDTPRALRLELGPLRGLFRGTVNPGELGAEPPVEYDPVFSFLEYHLATFCKARGKALYDKECETLFSDLRRRPDGRYTSALYVYFRAVLRLLLMVRPTSEAEYDAILQRLTRSARTFSVGPVSTYYYDRVLRELIGA